MDPIGHSRTQDPTWMTWVRQQPEWRCIVTGMDAERAHIRSKGAGGSDYWIIPLSHEQHMISHSKPSWWYEHRGAICEWCALTLPVLWERYAAEQIG